MFLDINSKYLLFLHKNKYTSKYIVILTKFLKKKKTETKPTTKNLEVIFLLSTLNQLHIHTHILLIPSLVNVTFLSYGLSLKQKFLIYIE